MPLLRGCIKFSQMKSCRGFICAHTFGFRAGSAGPGVLRLRPKSRGPATAGSSGLAFAWHGETYETPGSSDCQGRCCLLPGALQREWLRSRRATFLCKATPFYTAQGMRIVTTCAVGMSGPQ